MVTNLTVFIMVDNIYYYHNKNTVRSWKSRKNLTMIWCGFLSDHLLHILPLHVRAMNLLQNTLLPLENECQCMK